MSQYTDRYARDELHRQATAKRKAQKRTAPAPRPTTAMPQVRPRPVAAKALPQALSRPQQYTDTRQGITRGLFGADED